MKVVEQTAGLWDGTACSGDEAKTVYQKIGQAFNVIQRKAGRSQRHLRVEMADNPRATAVPWLHRQMAARQHRPVSHDFQPHARMVVFLRNPAAVILDH